MLPQQRVTRGSDEIPVKREQVEVIQLQGRLIRSRHAQRQFGVLEQRLLDLLLGVVAQPDTDVWKGVVEAADRVNEHIQDQVLRGGDVNLVRLRSPVQTLDKLAGSLEEGEGVRQEQPPLFGQRLPAAGTAPLMVEFDIPQALLQGEEAVAQSLLRDLQRLRRTAQAALPRQLDERRYLVRGQRQCRISNGESRRAAIPR